MTQRDVDVERRRALIALVRASLVELRYIEKRQGLRPARFDGRYELNATVVETADPETSTVRVVIKSEA